MVVNHIHHSASTFCVNSVAGSKIGGNIGNYLPTYQTERAISQSTVVFISYVLLFLRSVCVLHLPLVVYCL